MDGSCTYSNLDVFDMVTGSVDIFKSWMEVRRSMD